MKPLTDKQIEALTDKERLAILDEAIERIIKFPEDWNQGAWKCRTGFCLAGHIADLHGPGWREEYSDDIYLISGEMIGEFAERVLGLSPYYDPENQPLFSYTNSIYDLIRNRNDYAMDRDLPERHWSQRRLTRAERIAFGTNAARSDIQDEEFDLTPADHGWHGSLLEAKAYRAERKRQKAVEERYRKICG